MTNKEKQIRLDQTKKVFNAIGRMIDDGGVSYRTFIYDYLGFEPANYEELIEGLSITNFFVEHEDLKDNWDRLKEWSKHERKVAVGLQNGYGVALCDCMMNKIKELEEGNSYE